MSLYLPLFVDSEGAKRYIYFVNTLFEVQFAWDEQKNAANRRKHGVLFEEAVAVFGDENAIEYDDPVHSHTEERFLLLGLSPRLRILMISHCYRENSSLIRIISARKATQREAKSYMECT